MSEYGQFCSVARALEVLDERWTLLIVRELLMGATTFTDVRAGLPRIPRATLASRLRRLCNAGIVEARTGGYRLTDGGIALQPVLRELARWASTAESAELTEGHLDTAALTWDIRRRVNLPALPERAVVLAIDFIDRPAADQHFWLHLSRSEVNLCREDTGAPVDVWLTTPAEPATRWWLGQLTWTQLLRQPDVRVHGTQTLVRDMHNWFLRYVFAPDALTQTQA